MATSDDVAFLSATALIAGYRKGSFSPVEVARAILERIDACNGHLTAYLTVTHDQALADARVAENAYRTNSAGPLSGVPLSIKDLTPTKGIRTSKGSLVDPNWVPDFDPPLVERVKRAGSVMLGKTNTPELGWKGDSNNRIVGPTHNPWKHGKTAGGSSGGAGAAVAAGLGPIAQGSDGAGSIRIPAAFCGIYGIKPSFGLVPQYPASAVGDVSHLGPMTRTVRDAALMLSVIAGADARDRLSWSSDVDYVSACEGGVRGLRIAWSPDLGYAKVPAEIRTLCAAAASAFSELGADVVEASPDLGDPVAISSTLWGLSMAAVFRDRWEEVRELLDPGLVRVIEHTKDAPGIDALALIQERNRYYDGFRKFMAGYDLLLTPTLPCVAFDAGLDEPPMGDRHYQVPLDWTPFTYPFNLTGNPAATVPCGFVDGLPVGLQIVGRFKDDATVLRASAAFEAIRPWANLLPPDLGC